MTNPEKKYTEDRPQLGPFAPPRGLLRHVNETHAEALRSEVQRLQSGAASPGNSTEE